MLLDVNAVNHSLLCPLIWQISLEPFVWKGIEEKRELDPGGTPLDAESVLALSQLSPHWQHWTDKSGEFVQVHANVKSLCAR